MRGVGAGDIGDASGVKTWALFLLHHLTQSSVQMGKWDSIPFCAMTAKKLLPGASTESLCMGKCSTSYPFALLWLSLS
jgi:hypothetical protein